MRNSARVQAMRHMGRFQRIAVLAVMTAGATSWAQGPTEIVQKAVAAELHANRTDHVRWRYRDEQREISTVSNVVQTDSGSVKRTIEKDGRPLVGDAVAAEDRRVQEFIHSPSKLAKQKKDDAADDRNAEELMNMLPTAFTWKVEREDATAWTLHFEPDSQFRSPDMQSRVLGSMNGQLVVDKKQFRIKTISGKLTQDVTIGFGLLGRLREGGTFRVERREVNPGLWQITETHVHIDGKALMFKSIGQQQDEIQTDFRQVPGSTSLEAAAEMSKVGR